MFTLTQGSQAGLFPVKGQCKRLCSDLFRVLVLSFFFLSGNISIGHNSKMPWAITIKLGHNNNDPLPFMSHDPQGSKGHTGVTGVKSVISFKNFSTQTKNEQLWHRFGICIVSGQRTNVTYRKKIQRSSRVTSGSKLKIFSKINICQVQGGRIILLA